MIFINLPKNYLCHVYRFRKQITIDKDHCRTINVNFNHRHLMYFHGIQGEIVSAKKVKKESNKLGNT